MKSRIAFLAALAAFAAVPSAHAQDLPRVAASPFIPSYGQPVTIELNQTSMQTYLPANRYLVSGNTITVEYEYATNGVASSAMGRQPIQVGELPPGNYNVVARFYDINRPNVSPKAVPTTLAVVPPQTYGLYSIPMQAMAFAPTSILVRSAAYFDPSTMRSRVTGNVIRVDFEYASLPPGSDAPENMFTYGSVPVGKLLPPGSYTVEGWGRTNGGDPKKFFTTEMIVAQATPVVEYYSAQLDHYFMAAGADEIALLDVGRQGDWKRTGFTFNAFTRMSDAIPGSVPVCRFYASGPNSHFFTGSAAECNYLRSLEQSQRATDKAAGRTFKGWAYEGIAFYALMPTNGQCPSYAPAVKRFYNNRAAQGDTNHRFTVDAEQQAAMTSGWVPEGAQFCSAP